MTPADPSPIPSATASSAPSTAPAAARPRRRRRARNHRERAGMAILMVVTAIAICMVIVNEFGTRTSIDMLQARNNLDQMRAHFLARSSLNVTDLILRLQKRVEGLPDTEAVSLTMYASQLMDAFGGDSELVEGALGVPMEDLKGMGAEIGTFNVTIKPVEGKINVNCAAATVANQRRTVEAAIKTLIYPKLYDPVFEEADAEGWRRDRKTQVEAIMDYIDTNLDRYETPGAPEDYGYEGLRDPYKAKNKALDSISEMRLIRGVDDRFWTLFGDAFRVGLVSDCKINLRSLDDPKVIVAVILLAGEKDPTVSGNPDLAYLVAEAIADLAIKAQQFGPIFTSAQEFANFVKDPNAYASALLGGGTGSGSGSGAAPTSSAVAVPLPGGVTGIELDNTKLGELVQNRAVRFYEVEAYGEIARGGPLRPLKRTIRATFDQGFALQSSRVRTKLPGNSAAGTWLYLREE